MALLKRLLWGANAADVALLIDGEARSGKCFEWDSERRAVYLAGDDIPWPIVWLAARFSKKHVFTMTRRPSPEKVQAACDQFSRRMQWRWYFRNEDGLQPLVRRKRTPTPKAPLERNGEFLPGELQAWCSIIKSNLVRRAHLAVESRKVVTNTIPLVISALKLLRVGKWHLMLNDKDGGYCAMLKEEARKSHLEVLQSTQYVEEFPELIQERLLRQDYKCCCQEIAALEDVKQLKYQLMRGFSLEGLKASLTNLVKSHKDEGEVTFRAVHSMPSYGAEGVAAWLMQKLQVKLSSCDHILPDSNALVQRLARLSWKSTFRFTKLDVKDFYLTGSHEDIIDLASRDFEGNEANVVALTVRFLCSTQFVTSRWFPGRLWRATRGTGIGLKRSGHLTDYCFYRLVERKLFRTGKLEEWNVVAWFRFKDDILIVSDGDVPIDDVMASMANSCWKITRDELDVNTRLVSYLDVTIANPGPIVKVWPAYKETALLRRLGLESAHAPFVHRSWIRAMFRRVEKRCLNVDVSMHVDILSNRLIAGGVPAKVVEKMAESRASVPLRHNLVDRDVKVVWLPLPYHPLWANLLSAGLKAANRASDLRALLFQACQAWSNFIIKPAWSNSLPNLCSLIANTSR